ncbi:MAG: nucleotidyltransferase domain-containing protein [Actinomycetales bacterium]|nr:nucleotidyltransferase domain-containing protein [Actinomycetales bacterium]
MGVVGEQTGSLRAAIAANRAALTEVLTRYGASNPRLFGSVARGDARASSDVDVLVDLAPGAGNALLRIAGIGEEFSRILGVRVDVVTDSLLREAVSASAHRDAVAL